MVLVEIILLIIGIGAFVASFVIPLSKEQLSDEQLAMADEEIKNQIAVHVEKAASDIRDSVDETVQYAVDKTERSLERVTNEKIMAVNEYADTVLSDIHKNHEEVVFMYDMLNDKQVSLKNTVIEVEKTTKIVSKAAQKAIKTADEAIKSADEAQKSADEAQKSADEAQKSAGEAQRSAGEAVWSVLEAQVKAEKRAATAAAKAMAKLPKETVKPAVEKKAGKAAEPREKKRPTFTDKITDDILFETVTEGQNLNIQETQTQEPNKQERNKNEEILALYKSGKSQVEIAKELGLGVGEVKLVIDLFHL